MKLYLWLLRSGWRSAIVALLGSLLTVLILYILILIPFTPDISDIRKVTMERPTQILFADGKPLAEFKPFNRQWVKLSEISPYVIDALIATEDHRFYLHHGLDFLRTASAAVHTLGGSRQGGSTLTQQLARNLYPETIGRAPTLTRKIKEAITAFKIEALHSKEEILETYLNTVPFLYNAFGIEMAARTYFDSSADQLDLLQSATLVGLLKGNSYYNPVLNPERSLRRRNVVLAQMVKHGKLTPVTFEALKERPLRVDFERQNEPAGQAPHLAQYLRKWLIDWADRNDYNIHNDGLIVYTTLDSRLQDLANRSIVRQGYRLQHAANSAWESPTAWNTVSTLVRTFIDESPEYRTAISNGSTREQAIRQLQTDMDFMRQLHQRKTRVQAGFLTIDPLNGHIKAWVGSRDFGEDASDYVQQVRRQPGSAFAPFVYGEAFRQGIHPEAGYDDLTGEIRAASNDSLGINKTSLRDALTFSNNAITEQLMSWIGQDNAISLANKLGIRQSRLEIAPSPIMGSFPVTLREMTSAYAAIASGGNYRDLIMVTHIEDRQGNVIEEFHPAATENALDGRTAHTLIGIMRDVVDRGTGISIRTSFDIEADVAGQTGTTQGNTDGWFFLMHPQLVAGAWVGFNDERVTLPREYWDHGADNALSIVGEIFRDALHARIIDPLARFDLQEDLQLHMFDVIGDWISHFSDSSEDVQQPLQEDFSPVFPPEMSQPASSQETDLIQEKIDRILEKEKQEEARRMESMSGNN